MAPVAGRFRRASAKQAFSRALATLVAAAGLGGWPAAPAEGQTGDDSATYTVTFRGAWTTTSTPGGVVGGAHFTTLIGAVHNSQVTFWSAGGTASPGIEAVAELGATGTFKSEIQAKGSDVAATVEQFPGSGATGSATFEIRVTRNHPLLTLVSMIGPSPDWFVGVSRLSLLDAGGQWYARRSLNLYPYDAGTEEGEEFSLSNPATSPQGTITSIRGTGKFSNEAMATLSFVRKDPPPPRINVENAGAVEGDPVTFTVRLTGGTVGRDLALTATPASGPDDSATADRDYEAAARDLRIAAGRTSATFSVATIQDRVDEPDETFTVTLSPRPGTSLPAGVRIEAFDDAGATYGPVLLSIGANESVHINSGDLENGNAEKGLDGATGPGRGRGRLELTSPLDIEVLAYLRTGDGFVTSMHDVVPHTEAGHHVAIFKPGRNANQVSRLRLINRGPERAEVTIEGIDGNGESPGTAVRLSVPPRGARSVTARELESEEGRGEGLRDLVGALGDGAGKWRLVVRSDPPIEVMSLLASPTGHLTNLSTAPDEREPEKTQ